MTINLKKIIGSIDLSTYDPYDIWKTKLGYYIKKIYNKNKFLGLFPAVLFTIFDDINDSSKLFYKKSEYPIVRALAALSALELYKIHKDKTFLEIAHKHLIWLSENKSKFSNNYSWGINFNISINSKLEYDSNIGFVTVTPYALEAFILYSKLTNKNIFQPVILGVYNYLESDIKIMFENNNEMATSYGPFEDRIITNAISYVMYSYALLYEYIDNKEKVKERIIKLYNFIKLHQQEDGSWLYEPLNKNSFIDCFHTCFILKNIIKTKAMFDLSDSEKLISKGLNYLENNFYDFNTGLFKRFSISNKPSFIKWDLYDNAEMLNIYLLLNKKQKAQKLNRAIVNMFVIDENIYSQINFFNIKRKKNNYRWAMMPYLYALSKF